MNLEPMQLYLYLNPYTYRPKLYGQVTLMWNLVFHFVEHQEEDESFLISAWEEVIKVRRLGSSREREKRSFGTYQWRLDFVNGGMSGFVTSKWSTGLRYWSCSLLCPRSACAFTRNAFVSSTLHGHRIRSGMRMSESERLTEDVRTLNNWIEYRTPISNAIFHLPIV
ncbi:hypothetical protein BHM03_00002508 [Ensete ventricosum]|nr:hypothetical protein BHM03_00002508 [Ensete ventricosum]